MPIEPCCSCCGVPTRIYEESGHDRECIWYDDEIYRLAAKWLNASDDADWKKRYDLIVDFLLVDNRYLKEIADDLRKKLRRLIKK